MAIASNETSTFGIVWAVARWQPLATGYSAATHTGVAAWFKSASMPSVLWAHVNTVHQRRCSDSVEVAVLLMCFTDRPLEQTKHVFRHLSYALGSPKYGCPAGWCMGAYKVCPVGHCKQSMYGFDSGFHKQ